MYNYLLFVPANMDFLTTANMDFFQIRSYSGRYGSKYPIHESCMTFDMSVQPVSVTKITEKKILFTIGSLM